MKRLLYILGSALLAFGMTANAVASAIVSAPRKTEVPRVRWKTDLIKIAISDSLTQPSSNVKIASDVSGAISRSLQAWQNVADIQFQIESSDRQSVSPSGVIGDGVNLITVAQTPENVLLFSKNPLSEPAKTRVFFNRKGLITEADIVLNPFQQFSTDGTFGTFDLEATLTHEIGHLLGLRHSGVLGSTMANTLSKNGVFGYSDFGSRTLAASDIAAIRELYGITSTEDNCCGSIAGKISTANVRTQKSLRVWAEENGTGRVIAQIDTASDGSFRMGGMPPGTYTVFWQKNDDLSQSEIGELGLIKLAAGETKILNGSAIVGHSDLELNYAGLNSQLADAAVSLAPGREYTIYVGGKKLDPANVKFEFNSPFLTVSAASMMSHDFGDGISVVSFVLTVSPESPSGEYSIFAIDKSGSRSCMIGAIDIQ